MAQKLLPKSNAVVLSSSHKSRPFWEGRSPRWICQMMMQRACVPVTGGIFRLNKVTEPFIPIQVSAGSNLINLPAENLNVMHSHNENTTLSNSYAAYDEAPREIHLQPIQTVVKMHTRIPALYSTHHNQLEMQLSLSAEYMYESKENLIYNHPDWGLINNVAPKLQIKSDGGPTPDLLDDMLSRVWKVPDVFAMHPEAIASFNQTCNSMGIKLDTLEFNGGHFVCWRGIPILPTNKLYLHDGEGKTLHDRNPGKSKTDILLLRMGEDKQGVISLYAAGTEGSPRFPFITVDFMGISDESIASYIMTMYVAVAVLTAGALCKAEVVI